MLNVMVFGSGGAIAKELLPYLREALPASLATITCVPSHIRLDHEDVVARLLDEQRPDRVVCLAGRTNGGPECPTIDYLERPGKLPDNLRDNLYAPTSLAILCLKRNIHMTYLGTGCIFDRPTATKEDYAYTENDRPNYTGSSYSAVKGFTDRLMHLVDDVVLNVRIRMPIFAQTHERDFITKLTTYSRICSHPNSMTVLPSLLPILADMIVKKHTGTVNLVNPGVISHDEILTMYRDIVDTGFTWTNFETQQEHDELLSAKRSNNALDTRRLQELYPCVQCIHEAVRRVLEGRRRLST